MNFKFLSRGEGGTSNSAKGSSKPNAREETSVTSELGALKLNDEEIAEFEKWATQAKPNELMVKAAEMHRALRLKQVR
jgi:hypothetical protein